MDDRISAIRNAAQRIKDKRISLSEKALSYISEFTEMLIEEASEDEIFFRDEAFVRRYRALAALKGENNAAPYNKSEVSILEKQVNEAERALVCLSLSDILGIKGIEGSGTFFDDPPKTSGETVACVKSRASDDAYLAFAAEMNEPRVSYLHDLNEVAQSVLYGKNAYGIFPMANGRPILQKYGLRIAKRLTLSGGDGAETVFVLAKKDLDIPESAENAFFEFTVRTDDPSRIILASEVCSMKLSRISYSAESGSLTVTLGISDEGFCGFLTHLSLNYPDFVPIGIYKEL